MDGAKIQFVLSLYDLQVWTPFMAKKAEVTKKA
jgi:hypothetical protein